MRYSTLLLKEVQKINKQQLPSGTKTYTYILSIKISVSRSEQLSGSEARGKFLATKNK